MDFIKEPLFDGLDLPAVVSSCSKAAVLDAIAKAVLIKELKSLGYGQPILFDEVFERLGSNIMGEVHYSTPIWIHKVFQAHYAKTENSMLLWANTISKMRYKQLEWFDSESILIDAHFGGDSWIPPENDDFCQRIRALAESVSGWSISSDVSLTALSRQVGLPEEFAMILVAMCADWTSL
jgi:hypothetical protein